MTGLAPRRASGRGPAPCAAAVCLYVFAWSCTAGAGGLGAVGPEAGHTELEVGGGVLFILPQGTVAARTGLGAGTSLELRYTNIGVLGHSVDGRVGCGWDLGSGMALGFATRTGAATLEQANDVGGIAWNNLAIGNDWVAGADLVLSWDRAAAADITVELGATMTVGGRRYQNFYEAQWEWEPALRGLDAMVQGEWDLGVDKRLFVRLRGFAVLHTGLRPLGFFPTATGGVSWLF